MHATSPHLPIQRVPCALRHYLCHIDTKKPSPALSQRECQMVFQHWVAYIRGGDCGHPSEVIAKEYLMCPLLWCRESFDGSASTLQHVSECPLLSNTWYWCPYCCRPESFIPSKDRCTDTAQLQLHRKPSKLRRPVEFFKHLGHKSCSRHNGFDFLVGSELESHDTWLAKHGRFEMNYTPQETPELTAIKIGAHGSQPNSEKMSKTIHQMEGTVPKVNKCDLDDPPQYTENAGTAFETRELDISIRVVAPQFIRTAGKAGDLNWRDPVDLSPLTENAGTSFEPYELCTSVPVEAPWSSRAAGEVRESLTGTCAPFRLPQYKALPREKRLVSPVSAIQDTVSGRYPETYTSLLAKSEIVSPTYDYLNTVSSFESAKGNTEQFEVTPACNVSLQYVGGTYIGATLSPQSQAEELRETVRALNEEWMRRWQRISDLVLPASASSPKVLFEVGIQTLQLVFRGILPETFDATFALAHITFASAYLSHSDDRSHCWNTLVQDVLRWQKLMLNEMDTQLFIRLVNLLLWPQDSPAKLSCGDYIVDQISGKLVPLRKPTTSFHTSSSTETDGLQRPQCRTKPGWSPELRSLKDSRIFQECLRFLDRFEYAGIMERNKQNPTRFPLHAQNHVCNIEDILNTIIHPLRNYNGIEALRGIIDYTAVELRNGSLRNVREVEVSLISNGESSCLSIQVYTRYVNAVTRTCDHAMNGAGPNWRNRHYATHLDTVLALIVETENCQQLEEILPRHQQNTNSSALPRPTQRLAQGPPTLLCTESQTLVGSSPSTITSPSESSPTTQASSVPSPLSSFTAPSPSSSSADVTRCDICLKVFTGALRDRISNLKRHMRTTRDHGNTVGHLCPVAGCGAVLSRSDNMGKHIRTLHQGNEGVLQRPQGARKRGRDSEDAE